MQRHNPKIRTIMKSDGIFTHAKNIPTHSPFPQGSERSISHLHFILLCPVIINSLSQSVMFYKFFCTELNLVVYNNCHGLCWICGPGEHGPAANSILAWLAQSVEHGIECSSRFNTTHDNDLTDLFYRSLFIIRKLRALL